MTFGEKLKELRNAAGLTLAALASSAQIGLQTVKDYEGNRRVPSLEVAQSLAEALGVSCQAFDGCEFRHASQRKPQEQPEPAEKPEKKTNKRKGK